MISTQTSTQEVETSLNGLTSFLAEKTIPNGIKIRSILKEVSRVAPPLRTDFLVDSLRSMRDHGRNFDFVVIDYLHLGLGNLTAFYGENSGRWITSSPSGTVKVSVNGNLWRDRIPKDKDIFSDESLWTTIALGEPAMRPPDLGIRLYLVES